MLCLRDAPAATSWIRGIVAVCGVVLLWTAPASAQIYAWRDANGALVLSDRKLDESAATYALPTAAPDAPDEDAVRVTRPAASTSAYDRFESLVQEHAARQSLRPELVRAVIQVESGYNPRARSPKGAMGLMQLMPATASYLGVLNPYDPADNIRGGTRYLRQLLDRYDGNEELALAAYNAGAGAVDKYGKKIPPYRETVDYVRKISRATPPAPRETTTKPGSVIYKIIEIVDGQPRSRYSTDKPTSGEFEIVGRR
jgi:soluble lytic murein transglycosylase-like protein